MNIGRTKNVNNRYPKWRGIEPVDSISSDVNRKARRKAAHFARRKNRKDSVPEQSKGDN